MDISSTWKNLPWTRAWLKSAQLWLHPPSMLFWPCLFPGTKHVVLMVGWCQTWDYDLPKSQNSKFHAAGKDLMATSMLLLHSRPRSYHKAVRLGLSLVYYMKNTPAIQWWEQTECKITRKKVPTHHRRDWRPPRGKVLQGPLSGPVRLVLHTRDV